MSECLQVISRKDAMAKGLTRYFTGKPCKRGHIAGRLCSNKICCDCRREHKRKYREANREKESEHKRKYYEANREKMIERSRKYREANREKESERKRKYREANREKVKELSRKWHEENPDYYRMRYESIRAQSHADDTLAMIAAMAKLGQLSK